MFTGPFDARRPLVSRRLFSSRPCQKARFRRLLAEYLEDRRLLSIADLSPTNVTAENGSLGSMDLSTILWQGEEQTVCTGHWIVGLDGLPETPAGQLAKGAQMFQQHAAGPALTALRGLGGRGSLLIEAAPEVSYEQLQKSLSTIPGFRYVEPDFVISLEATPPNDLGFRDLYGLNNVGQTGGTIDADIDATEAWDVTIGDGSVVVGRDRQRHRLQPSGSGREHLDEPRRDRRQRDRRRRQRVHRRRSRL